MDLLIIVTLAPFQADPPQLWNCIHVWIVKRKSLKTPSQVPNAPSALHPMHPVLCMQCRAWRFCFHNTASNRSDDRMISEKGSFRLSNCTCVNGFQNIKTLRLALNIELIHIAWTVFISTAHLKGTIQRRV